MPSVAFYGNSNAMGLVFYYYVFVLIINDMFTRKKTDFTCYWISLKKCIILVSSVYWIF